MRCWLDTIYISSACKVRTCCSSESHSLPNVPNKSSFYDPVRWLCSCFPHKRTWFVLLTSATNHSSCISCRCSVKLVRWILRLYCRSNRDSALFFLPWLRLIDPPHTPSLPHLMKIDLFCLDFHSAFRLRDFSLQCQLYIFSECVPVIKEKATQPGPRQQGKVDTNVIETGYWYSPCWLPAHLGRELCLLCTLSMEVFRS